MKEYVQALSPSPIRIRPVLTSLGVFLFAIPVAATWTSDGVPGVLQLLSGAMLLTTVARPSWGLLALAFLLPLTPYLAALVDAEVGRVAVAEIVVAPFLVGAIVRTVGRTRWPGGRLGGPALLFGSLVAVSAVLQLAERQRATTWPLDFAQNFLHHLFTGYFESPGDFAAFHEAAIWIEGLSLAVIAERVLRLHRLGWPSVLLAGASVVAVTSWIRLLEISLRQDRPFQAAIEFLRSQRIQTLFTDVNAAASLFVLFFVPAAWQALRGSHPSGGLAGGLARGAYAVSAILLALALYMPHSRAAYAGAIVAFALLWVASHRVSGVALASGLGVASLLLALFVIFNPGSRAQVSAGHSMGIRWEMGRIALRLTEQSPAFGIGLGEFRHASRAFVTPELQALFPAVGAGENAHNNFLQILAELGVVGLIAFLWLLVPAIQSGMAARRHGGSGSAALGLVGGLVAFLVSCLAGHPLLTPEVLWAFCLTLGAAVGLAPSPHASERPLGFMARLLAVLTLAVIVLAPVRLWQLHRTDLERGFLGAGPLVHEGSEIAYRRVGARSSWFVPNATRVARLPLRVTTDSPASCFVRIDVDGLEANVLEVTPQSWSPLILVLDPREARSASRRVDLRVDDPACRLMVGTPTYRE